MANHATLTSLFSDIAKAIRSKTGGTATIVADNFPTAIDSIVTLSGGSSDATATAGEILTGKTAYVNGAKVTGSMANNGAVSQAINAGGSYTIPAGYHNGSGKVTGNSLSSQTSATAGAGDIRSGKTAWVNGSLVTGNLVPPTADTGEFSLTEKTTTVTIATNKRNFVISMIPNMSTGNGYTPASSWSFMMQFAYINGVPYAITYDSGEIEFNANDFGSSYTPNVSVSGSNTTIKMGSFRTYYFYDKISSASSSKVKYRWVAWD